MNGEGRATRLGIALGCAPLVALAMVRFVAPVAGPSAASAGESAASAGGLERYASEEASEAELAYIEHCEALGRLEKGTTPFHQGERIEELEAGERGPAPAPAEPAPGRVTPSVEVTSILTGGRMPLAVIDGRPYRVGAAIGEGWVLESIDDDGDAVVLMHSEHGSAKVAIRRGTP